jgi:hypothetical protein
MSSAIYVGNLYIPMSGVTMVDLLYDLLSDCVKLVMIEPKWSSFGQPDASMTQNNIGLKCLL